MNGQGKQSQMSELTAVTHAENVQLESSADISTKHCCWNMQSDAAKNHLLISIVPCWLFYIVLYEKWVRKAAIYSSTKERERNGGSLNGQ